MRLGIRCAAFVKISDAPAQAACRKAVVSALMFSGGLALILGLCLLLGKIFHRRYVYALALVFIAVLCWWFRAFSL
jgi:hypothetical protein